MGSNWLVGDIVDAVVLLVRFTIGVDHWSLVAFAGETILLQMSFLFAVSAFSVGVTKLRWAVVTLVVAVVVAAVVAIVVVSVSAKANRSELSELIVRQAVPRNLSCLFFFHFISDGVNFVEPLMVILNRLEVASDLNALVEGGLGSFQNFIADAILQSGQEKLMLDELQSVINAFGFDLGLRGSRGDGGADRGHGGGLRVREALVGHLYTVSVVVDALIWLLVQISEICAGCLGRIFWLVGF